MTQKIVKFGVSAVGFIAEKLTTLRGYDVMAFELLQNADDSGATNLEFHIRDDALEIKNDSVFISCTDRVHKKCYGRDGNPKNLCDWHRFREIASGNKPAGKIGRFGLGFVSVYQVTDMPSVSCDGTKLEFDDLYNENATFDEIEMNSGTTFRLPWAFDPSSDLRRDFKIEALKVGDLDKIAQEIAKAMSDSLLFLRNVVKVSVFRNAKKIISCEIKQINENEKSIIIEPNPRVERWFISKASAAEEMKTVELEHPSLVEEKREKDVQIAIPIEGVRDARGRIYAYLPTQRLLGFQMHVNADFYPESSRKDIIFPSASNSDGQSSWNIKLVKSAARLMAEHVPKLYSLLGEVDFWQLVKSTNDVFKHSSDPNMNVPASFKFFWLELQKILPDHELVVSEDGSNRLIKESLIVEGENVPSRRKALLDIGLYPAGESMAEFFDLLVNELGGTRPDLGLVVEAVANSTASQKKEIGTLVTADELKERLVPLWELLESLIPRDETKFVDMEIYTQLQKLIIFVSSQDRRTSLLNCFTSIEGVEISNLHSLFPDIVFLSSHIRNFPKILKLSHDFGLTQFCLSLEKWINLLPEKPISEIANIRKAHLVLRQLSFNREMSESELYLVKSLKIWPSLSGSLIASKNGKILGNFTDPLATDNLINLTIMDKESGEFLRRQLSVEELNIKNYVTEVLPELFADSKNDIALEKYKALIFELSNHPVLTSDKNCKIALQKMKLIRTIDGDYFEALNSVFLDSKAEGLLGSYFRQWVDNSSFPDEEIVRRFLKDLGVQKTPNAFQVVSVWKALITGTVPRESKEITFKILRYLMSLSKEWSSESLKTELAELRSMLCLPARGSDFIWHSPSDLYGTEWVDAFSSQAEAKVLDFDRPKKEELRFLANELGLKEEPEVRLVIDHLILTSKVDARPSPRVYEFLNRASKDKRDLDEIKSLRNIPSIHLDDIYVKPSKLFIEDPKIGKPWVYKINETFYNKYKHLFEVLDIAVKPKPEDILNILRELMDEYKDKSANEVETIRDQYYWCWHALNLYFQQEAISQEVLERLKQESLLLSVTNKFKLSNRLLIADSDWFKNRFDEKFDDHLLYKPDAAPELFTELGVGLVSVNIEATLDQIGGKSEENLETQKIFYERCENLGVVLAKLDSKLNHKEVWAGVSVYMVDSIISNWRLSIPGADVASVKISSQIFFNMQEKKFYLVRNIKIEWVQIFKEMLQQLFPAQPDNTLLPNLALMDLIVSKDPVDGRDYLMSLGYTFEAKEVPVQPSLPSSETSYEEIEPVTGTDSDDRSMADVEGDPHENDLTVADENAPETINEPAAIADLKSTIRPEPLNETKVEPINDKNSTGERENPRKTSVRNDDVLEESEKYQNKNRDFGPDGHDKVHLPKPRSASWQEPVRKAFIYVEGENEEHGQDILANRLDIESKARKLVIAEEEIAGRIPEEMPLNNPGYDIESQEKDTGDYRYIEIKSLAGPWGATGVSLSYAQLNVAYRKKDAYWIYVVENVRTSEPKIYRIQNPVKYISGFKFNDAWMEFDSDGVSRLESNIKIEPQIDKSYVGQRVSHLEYGEGWLIELKLQGVGRLATINFDTAGQKSLSWNTNVMRLI